MPISGLTNKELAVILKARAKLLQQLVEAAGNGRLLRSTTVLSDLQSNLYQVIMEIQDRCTTLVPDEQRFLKREIDK